MVYKYTGISFSLLKKEILSHPATWLNLKDIILSEKSQSQKVKYWCFHLREVPKVVKLIGIEWLLQDSE